MGTVRVVKMDDNNWNVRLENHGIATIGVPTTYGGALGGYARYQGQAREWAAAIARVLGDGWRVSE